MMKEPVAAALREFRRGFWSVAVFSAGVNLLMLAGPLYMLQIYDRVLASGSVPTLIGITIFIVGAYGFQALLEIIRTRVVVRLSRLLDDRLDTIIHQAIISAASSGRQKEAAQPVRDLDQLRSFLLSPGPIAIVDAPWVPIFLFLCYLLHPWLGFLSLGGALALVALALLTERASRPISRELAEEGNTRALAIEARRHTAESAVAMGMVGALGARWTNLNGRYSSALRRSSDVIGGFGAASKVLRLLLQSAILGTGAYLVIQHQLTAGSMIAASIMMGRALAPIETAIGNWRGFVSARQGTVRLRKALAGAGAGPAKTALPRPSRRLDVEGVTVAAPGSRVPIVARLQFALAAGEGLAVIGPSGSGKSSLGRTLVGVWPPALGSIRLDGATLDQWEPDALGPHLGYLSQSIDLFDGTIAENIARLDPQPDSAAVIAAAEAAGAHDMILQLAQGYDTSIGDGGVVLSAGQRQRIGLARALYRDPAFIVLDEPNSNLDGLGEAALVQAIRAAKTRGAMVVLITHKPSITAVCEKALFLSDGLQKAFGPREDVLRQVLAQPVPSGPGPLRTVGGDADRSVR